MRSIGKRNIKKLKAIVEDEYKKMHKLNWGAMEFGVLEDNILERVPSEWYDLWESSHSEIENIIDETVQELIWK